MQETTYEKEELNKKQSTSIFLNGVDTNKPKVFNIRMDIEDKEIIDIVHSIRGGTRKDFIRNAYLIEYNILMRKGAIKKRLEISELRLEGLLKQFDRWSGIVINRRGEDYSNYNKFGYWFNGLYDAEKELILKNTLNNDRIDAWVRVVINHGSLTGHNYKTLVQYLEDAEVLDKLKAHAIIIQEREVFEDRLKRITKRKEKYKHKLSIWKGFRKNENKDRERFPEGFHSIKFTGDNLFLIKENTERIISYLKRL